MEKIIFKGCITVNSDLLTKILHVKEIRIQHWLVECQKFSDRSMVNDRLISFDEIFEMVMNNSLDVILPPNFIKPPPKNPLPKLNPMPGPTASKRGKKRKLDKATGDHIIKNAAPITEFLIKESKDWRQDFAGKCLSDRPKWDNTIFICARWSWIRSECFVDCNNNASHVRACTVPQAKRTKFKKYLGKVHGDKSPSSLA